MRIGASIVFLGVALLATAASAHEPIAKARVTYTPWQAGWDAYARSEQARLHAIDRQRQVNDLMSWYGTIPGYYQPVPVIAHGRGQRRYERSLSQSPYLVPFPGSPGYAYPGGGKVVPVLPYLNPSPPPVEQPVGHRKTWTGANSYIYEPLYASDQSPQEESTLTYSPEPMPSESIPTPPALPEAIPTPQPQ
ncbi:MAG: hypothetical protein GXX96_20000 [Planctomycetaceae bacterium]|jgi:hypothetical protein|nr:hypothetical protein [Planctomycetaceae bacterium]